MSMDEVAKKAGVSTATVSRVMNGSRSVKASTRARVEAIISQEGYTANRLARNLRTAESRLLITMVPDFSNPFYAEIVKGIDAVARRHGYHLLLCDTGASLTEERTYFDMLRTHLADGAICLDPDSTQRALASENSLLQWVACCEFDPKGSVPYVGIDNAKAARDAVKYLVERGRRRIAFINSDERFLYARQRKVGYMTALSEAGLTPYDGAIVKTDGLTFDDGRRVAKRLLASAIKPDAIFAVSDTLAIGAMQAVHELGLRVPQDVAVIGFDNIPLATMVQPALTTIAQPMFRLGENAANLLLERMRDPSTPALGTLLDHELVIRNSA
ncbi:LacI family repressor for deo operon, udp, cdd, tsx, nupC, and nupG [Paraburkholderia sp. MM5496-R1]